MQGIRIVQNIGKDTLDIGQDQTNIVLGYWYWSE